MTYPFLVIKIKLTLLSTAGMHAKLCAKSRSYFSKLEE